MIRNKFHFLTISLLFTLLWKANKCWAQELCADRCISYAAIAYGFDKPKFADSKSELLIGTSVKELDDKAHLIGFNAIAEWGAIDDLKSENSVKIVHLKNNHYAVVDGVSNGFIVLIDYPNSPIAVKEEDFLKYWDNSIIELSVNSKSPKRSSLALINPDVYLNSIGINQEKKFFIKVLNYGANIKYINKIVPSCGCIIPFIDKINVPPASIAELPVRFIGRAEPETFGERIILNTSDLIFPNQTALIHINVIGNYVFNPSIINYGRLRASNKMTVHIDLDGADTGDGEAFDRRYIVGDSGAVAAGEAAAEAISRA